MVPDKDGHFGEFGGKFVPEVLMGTLHELEGAFEECRRDENFLAEFSKYLKEYSGRPTPLYFAENLTRELGGARIYLKREDLNHTGSHKINNALGQILLARYMGKKRIIAETGAGQHGVAAATVAALFGMECVIYMGEEDIKRQALNVFRMKLLGAEVRTVSSGSKTLKDAVNEAIRDWVTNVDDTFYLIGSVIGPHPYPTMVKEFQSVIGQEARKQILEMCGCLPDYVIACVGGGSNAMGVFSGFVADDSIKLIGVEAGGLGIDSGKHGATLQVGTKGVLQGTLSYLLQDEDGQIQEAHSVSAGLDYPGVGPEHSYLKETGRAQYVAITDDEAIAAFCRLTKSEGIIPALESSHAVGYALKLVPTLSEHDVVVINLSGRGDKDVYTIGQVLGVEI